MLTTIVAFVLVLGFLILIHEGGHFFAARLSRVWVHEFAVGFGPALWRRKTRETLYALRAIPIGGYVRMAGEVEPGGEAKEDDAEEAEVPRDQMFSAKSPWARMGIIFAGPFTNIVGAIALMIAVVLFFGSPYVQVFEFASDESPAAQVLERGDMVLAINGETISSISQIQNVVSASGERPLQMTVLRNGERVSVSVTPEWTPEHGRFLIGATFLPSAQTNQVKSLDPSAYLAEQGLNVGDRITALNGEPVNSAFILVRDLQRLQQQAEDKTAVLSVQPQTGAPFEIPLDLSAQDLESLFSAISFQIPTRQLGLFEGVRDGVQQTWNLTLTLYRGIMSIVAGEISAGEAFSGPVGIANILGQGLQQGWLPFFQLIAILSLNLGILNLVPLPALDGSRLMFITVELVRGKPISPRVEGIIHQVGFVLLLGLILLITFNDILKIVR